MGRKNNLLIWLEVFINSDQPETAYSTTLPWILQAVKTETVYMMLQIQGRKPDSFMSQPTCDVKGLLRIFLLCMEKVSW